MRTYMFSLPPSANFKDGVTVPFTTHDFPNALASLGQWAIQVGYDIPSDATIQVRTTEWVTPQVAA